MRSLLRPTLVLLAFMSLLTGLAYPLAVTAAAGALFPQAAGGSLVLRDGQVVGSHFVGQHFDEPRYFWGRPSATGKHPYDAASSTGSNQGPTNPALREAIAARADALRAAHPGVQAPLPVDLVTASGSGLDPHISPAAARFQVARVAHARGLPEAQVAALVEAHVEGRWLGPLGQPTVNVLLLNLALDELAASGG